MGRFVNRAIATLIVILFIVVASISACTAAFRDSLVNIETYKQTFDDQNIYKDIVPYVMPAILNDREGNFNRTVSFPINLDELNDAMSIDDWREVSEELIPPEWLQVQVESILDTINLISQGDFTQPETLINTTEFINRLQGEEGLRASEIIMASAPDCTAQQVIALQQFEDEDDQVFPFCNPPSRLQGKSNNIVHQWFQNLGGALQLQLSLQGNVLTIQDDTARLLYNLFQLDSQLSLLFMLCPMVLIGFIMLFAVRNLKGFGRWMGWSFLLSGIVTLVLMFTSQVPVFATFDEVVRANTDVERFEAQIYAGFVRSVYVDASTTMLFIAGLMIALGFIFLVISAFGKSQSYLVPEGSVLITEDGRVISTATQQSVKTLVIGDDS